ncbi:RHS repeat-associated core domain-containing protein, partial [Escherichia coli]
LPGQQYDEESGLYYNRHRYYDPLQGRYITQDPIGLKGGWNLYGYQLNPISDIDPLGLSMWEDAKSGACTNGLCGTLSGNDSNLLIVFYVQIMPDDFVMQLHR